MKELLNNIKSVLEADETLAEYIEIVEAGEYDRENLPDFDRCAIVVSPARDLRKTEIRAVREKQHLVQANVVCLRWRFQDAGALAGSDPPGILKMIEDVWTSLNGSDFDGHIEKLGGEATAGIVMEAINNGAYYEAVIPLSCYLPPFND